MVRKANVRRNKSEQIEHEQRLRTASKQPPRRIAKGEDVLDVRLESPLGRLNFIGKISKEQYEAGTRYRELAFRYLHAIGAPYPFEQSQPGDYTPAGLMQMPVDVEAENWEREYNRAYEALFRVGQRAAKAVKGIAVYERDVIDDFDFNCLTAGLRALAQHFAGDRPSNVIPFSRFMVMG
jgi:hypothetical protein